MALSKKTRFEVFKRDSFTCQYCGRKSPDVVLEVDHIKPRSKGGTDDILNLVTSCVDCNSGKSNRELSDQQTITQKRKQLEELQQRKEQLEMMFEWQEGLLGLETQAVDWLHDMWRSYTPGYSLSDFGLRELRKLYTKFGVEEVVAAMSIAASQYITVSEGKAEGESVNLAWRRLGGICANRRRDRDNPQDARLYYIRGILRKRLSYMNDWLAIGLLRKASEFVTPDYLEELAKEQTVWTNWRTAMEDIIDEGTRES